AVVDDAPCQCFLPGGQVITSPGRISSFGSPSHCVQPSPAVTIRVCPHGCTCHAERAPGSNVTLAPLTFAGPGDWNRGSIRTLPVKYSVGPRLEGCAPFRWMVVIACFLSGSVVRNAGAPLNHTPMPTRHTPSVPHPRDPARSRPAWSMV